MERSPPYVYIPGRFHTSLPKSKLSTVHVLKRKKIKNKNSIDRFMRNLQASCVTHFIRNLNSLKQLPSFLYDLAQFYFKKSWAHMRLISDKTCEYNNTKKFTHYIYPFIFFVNVIIYIFIEVFIILINYIYIELSFISNCVELYNLN